MKYLKILLRNHYNFLNLHL